jgi:adenine deaminase
MALLIRGGQLLNSTQMTLDAADVLIAADQIVAVGCQRSSPPGTEELNAAGHLNLPGLVNAHTPRTIISSRVLGTTGRLKTS